jgi:hypothetical protein
MFPSIRGLLSRRRIAPPPMIFVTHAKAGSTWVDRILRGIYGKQVAPRLFDIPEKFSFAKHRIYSAIFMNRGEYLQHPELFGIHRFVVIRDLRDTLVSYYFSTRDTHEEDPGGRIAARRKILLEHSEEDGLLYLIDNVFHRHAGIQESWVGTETPLFRYEDLLQRDAETFVELLAHRFGHAVPQSRIEDVVAKNRFENDFWPKARRPGFQFARPPWTPGRLEEPLHAPRRRPFSRAIWLGVGCDWIRKRSSMGGQHRLQRSGASKLLIVGRSSKPRSSGFHTPGSFN